MRSIQYSEGVLQFPADEGQRLGLFLASEYNNVEDVLKGKNKQLVRGNSEEQFRLKPVIPTVEGMTHLSILCQYLYITVV